MKSTAIMYKLVIYFLTLYMCYYTVASVTFSFHTNSSTIQVYEGDMLEVCIQGEEVSTSTEVEIVWRVAPNKNSAIAGSDFSPKQLNLQFSHSSTPQIKCGNFSIIRDRLDEDVEYFILTLEPNHGQFTGNPILVRVNSCRENDINLQQTPSTEGGLSLVEYCNNGYWVTLCDSKWTLQDAMVTCRQAGYSEEDSGKAIPTTMSKAVQNILGKVPKCSSNETQLVQCMKMTNKEDSCHPVLVKCGASEPNGASQRGFNTAEVAAMTGVPCVVVALIAGALLGVLLHYGITRVRSKPRSQSKTQESVSVYEDVDKINITSSGAESAAIELKLNVECGPSKQKQISTRPNMAYGHAKL